MLSGFGPPPSREHPASASTASAGAVTFLPSGESEGKAKKARLIPVATVRLRKHEVFISLSEPIALPVSIAACETSAATPSSARSCRAAEGSLSSWLALLLLCGTKITVQIGPRRNQSSTLLRVAVSRTHMAALFPNHRANEEVPKDLKVNREQRD